MEPNGVLNLVLLGTKGAGKSSSGRTILGQQAFSPKKGSSPDTRIVAVESGTFEDINIIVYDTPGLIDTDLFEDKIEKILEKIQQRCESGPCAFLLVIKADRFAEEERKFVEKIEEVLGEERLEKTWILFTGGDELERKNMTIKEFIDKSELLKKHLQKYDQRYHVFSNEKKGHTEIQVKTLLRKIHRTWWLKTPEGGRLTRRIPVIRPNALDKPQMTAVSLSSRRIVLLGKTGVGKSATGNTILGEEEFNSDISSSSVTSECLEKHGTVSGRSVFIVDTPGFFDTQMRHEELAKEIARSVYLSSPGPHAFLVVLRVNDRFTEHEQQVPQMIEMLFGEEVLKYSIILFTHGDLLKGKSVEKLIHESCTLRDLVQQCGGRFHVFNNENERNSDQVNDLLKKIDTMIEQNGGGHYSNQMYEDAERFRREEEEQRQRGIERKETGFNQFHKEYEQTFSYTSGLTLGSIIGGCLGLIAGPIGVAVGAAVGAGIGALVDYIRLD